jgi:FkbM family methyltransferase
MKLAKSWRLLCHYLNHPLGRRDRWGTLARIARWQVGSRLLRAPAAVPFVDATRLLVSTGMHGATGNVYVGLMEFEDMAFALHLLKKDDVFLDVGANVGVYSILAASRASRVLAMEPVPTSYEQLLDNINLNRFQALVEPKNIGLGSHSGKLRFSARSGPTDHVLAENESTDDSVVVVVKTLDDIAPRGVTMIKVDVEGFEAEVIRGATDLLAQHSLQAVLIELNGLGARYGFSDADIHARLLGFGFKPVRYDPFKRQLVPLDRHNRAGNTLYVRQSDKLDQRLRTAWPAVWQGVEI